MNSKHSSSRKMTIICIHKSPFDSSSSFHLEINTIWTFFNGREGSVMKRASKALAPLMGNYWKSFNGFQGFIYRQMLRNNTNIFENDEWILTAACRQERADFSSPMMQVLWSELVDAGSNLAKIRGGFFGEHKLRHVHPRLFYYYLVCRPR